MDTLTSLKVLREVVEVGSFVSAAERLGISAPMASKHVAHLERELNARLLNRTSRHLSLTEAGAVYFEQCRDALDTLQSAEAAIGEGSTTPRGLLKVTAPVWFANRPFADAIADYQQRYPDVLLDIRLENRRVDLVAEGYDLALRATREPTPSLIVRPITQVPFQLVASPDWVERHGAPRSLAELARCKAVMASYLNTDSVEFDGPSGRVHQRMAVAMKTDDTTLSLHTVMAGVGIALLPAWVVQQAIERGQLVALLPGYTMPPPTLYAVYTSRKYLTPKVRTFIDHFSAALAGC